MAELPPPHTRGWLRGFGVGVVTRVIGDWVSLIQNLTTSGGWLMEGWAGPGTVSHSLGGQSTRKFSVVTKAPPPFELY